MNKVILAIIITALVTTGLLYLIFVYPIGDSVNRDEKGYIPMAKAMKYADGHQKDRSYNRWRSDSRGAWFEAGELKDFLIKFDSTTPPPGYAWKVAVLYGGQIDGNKKKLQTMFSPMLISTQEPQFYIDAVTAYRQSVDDGNAIWHAKLTYSKVFEEFKKMAAKEKPNCMGCIVFDEGNMFP